MSAAQPLPDPNVRSRSYYVACTNAGCWHCGLSTRLLALAVPHGHEILDADPPDPDDDQDAAAPGAWQRANINAFLFYVEFLSDGVQRRLIQLSRDYRLARSAATLSSYWANHCQHCGALLDDHELHCEPDSAFMPTSEDAATSIQLVQIQEPFEALAAGYALEPEFFRFMKKS
jgi:hypothetical protein